MLEAELLPRMDDSSIDLLRRRAKPRVLMLDAQLNIAYAEPHAIAMIARFVALEYPHRLPPRIESSIREIALALLNTEDGDHIVVPVPGLVLRLARVDGSDGTFVCVLVEEEGRRDSVQTASKRYALTRRESEVLELLLTGLSANEIAGRMSLASATVSDYFKALIRKTGAKNRSDMLAKVLDFTH